MESTTPSSWKSQAYEIASPSGSLLPVASNCTANGTFPEVGVALAAATGARFCVPVNVILRTWLWSRDT